MDRMLEAATYRTMDELEARREEVLTAPKTNGTLELIVRRPEPFEREVVDTAELSLELGLVGDNWKERGSRHTPDGSAEIDRQVTIMSARAITLFAGDDRTVWPLAGDQLYVEIDLSEANLPAGTRLRIGDQAVVEVSALPHTGCAKFLERFGRDASRFMNAAANVPLRLRGINVRVIEPGTIRQGDTVTKIA